MVKLLIGHKGSGKTKKMVDLANSCVEQAKGSVVFINKNSRLTTDLKYSIRVICMDDYEAITNVDEYIGFLYGVVSQDHDIEVVYIDSILKHADISLADIDGFVQRLNALSVAHNIDFYVSLSADKDELGSFVEKYEIVEITL